MLRLVVATQYITFHAQEGRFLADQLKPFITRVRRLLDKSAGQEESRDIQYILGSALLAYGEQTGDKQSLEDAVAAYRAVLAGLPFDAKHALERAGTQNSLGFALWRLGERERNTARLEDALEAFRNALKDWPDESKPIDWAVTQMNRGNALMTLGEREGNTARLEDAVKAFDDALSKLSSKEHALERAKTQNSRGAALMRLGTEKGDTARLEQAIAAKTLPTLEEHLSIVRNLADKHR